MIIPGVVAGGRQVGGGGATDPFYANVAALLHFNGTDGSTVLVDQKGTTWRIVGTAQLDTAFLQFGSASLFLPATSSAIFANNATYAFGTGDLTIEMWLRLPSTAGINCNIFYFGATDDTSAPPAGLYATPAGNLILWINGDRITGSSVVSSSFVHIAISRNSGTFRLFINGVSQGTYSDSSNYSGQFIKAGRFASSNYIPPAHIDDLRVTTGVGRYTANFTPPAAQFPDS